VLRACQQAKLARGAKDEEHAMSDKLNSAIGVTGIDIGKNSFHVVGHHRVNCESGGSRDQQLPAGAIAPEAKPSPLKSRCGIEIGAFAALSLSPR